MKWLQKPWWRWSKGKNTPLVLQLRVALGMTRQIGDALKIWKNDKTITAFHLLFICLSTSATKEAKRISRFMKSVWTALLGACSDCIWLTRSGSLIHYWKDSVWSHVAFYQPDHVFGASDTVQRNSWLFLFFPARYKLLLESVKIICFSRVEDQTVT